MKTIKTLLCLILCLSTLVIFASCHKPPEENTSDIIEVIGVATWPTWEGQTEKDSAAVSLTAPPAVGISYQYKVSGEGLVAAHRITSGIFSWTVPHENGLSQVTHVEGSRPCDVPGTQHIPLEKVKDYGYTVDISLEEEIIQSYTLKAYPVGNYDFDGTECTLQDGKLSVLKGKYYYELVIEYTQGQAVYGFFVD